MSYKSLLFLKLLVLGNEITIIVFQVVGQKPDFKHKLTIWVIYSTIFGLPFFNILVLMRSEPVTFDFNCHLIKHQKTEKLSLVPCSFISKHNEKVKRT